MPLLRLRHAVATPSVCARALHAVDGSELVLDASRLTWASAGAACGATEEALTDVGAEYCPTACVLSVADANALLLSDWAVALALPAWAGLHPGWVRTTAPPVLEVRLVSEEMGRGVFTATGGGGLRAGTIVCEYAGFLSSFVPPFPASSYAVAYPAVSAEGKAMTLDAAQLGNVGRLVNHSANPNCAFAIAWLTDNADGPRPIDVPDDALRLGLPRVLVLATEDIAEGAQLLVDYGAEFWRARGRAPL